VKGMEEWCQRARWRRKTVLDAAGDIAVRSLVRRASAAATLVVCFSMLQPRGASSEDPEYSKRILQTSGPLGFTERGIDLGDGRFWPGTTGSEWTPPMKEDIERAQKGTGKKYTDWTKTSWKDVNCCGRLKENEIWEDKVTGVPNCFCRDLLQQTGYKTVAKCMLKQACENALRDWNKVFGEGYMVKGEAEDWNTESPLRTCTKSDYAHDSWSHMFGAAAIHESCGIPHKAEVKFGRKQESYEWPDPFGRGPVYENMEPSPWYGKCNGGKCGCGEKTPCTIQNNKDPKRAKPTKFKWVPGDVPLTPGGNETIWQGFRAGNNAVEEGLMAGSRVYPGKTHSLECLRDANSSACVNSSRMLWTGPVDSFQADCMYAVKRAICAYHFWECDASYGAQIYNGICEPTCTDIPRLCGTIPSTGEPLEVKRFTLGNFYHLGCTVKKRQFLKDCTAEARRETIHSYQPFAFVLLTSALILSSTFI